MGPHLERFPERLAEMEYAESQILSLVRLANLLSIAGRAELESYIADQNRSPQGRLPASFTDSILERFLTYQKNLVCLTSNTIKTHRAMCVLWFSTRATMARRSGLAWTLLT